MKWREYEIQVFQEFQVKYPQHEIYFDQKLIGRFSEVPRQVDVLVKTRISGDDVIGVFDCKCFSKNVDVKVIDSMFGFMDDLNANYGGIVTTKGFSDGAKKRASAASMELRVIKFTSPQTVIDEFVPRLDFSDPRNSMYIPLLFL